MRYAIVVAVWLASAIVSPYASAQEADCRLIKASGASFLEQCGDQLNSFSLNLVDLKRSVSGALEGWFSFGCPIELMCEGEPIIGGWFITPGNWNSSAKDAHSIIEIFKTAPMVSKKRSDPQITCSLFDVTLGDLSGRGVCIGDAEAKWNAILAIVSDDHVGIALSFYLQGASVDDLRSKTIALLSRFAIERAKGDAKLMRWMR